MTRIAVGIALALAVGVAAWANRNRIAVLLAPSKTATSMRSDAALKADELFWHTLHSGAYDDIPRVSEVLMAAYLEAPTDAVTAAHIAWLHNWRVAERVRLSAVPATITDHTILARRYFDEAVRLNPSDARTLGFLAGHILAEGTLRAYDVSAVLVGKSHWRCELLDGGALAAQQLKRSDVAKRLAAAWHAAPTLTRLLRWLVTEDRSPTALRAKARRIVSRCPKTAGRQLGLLRLLGGDISAAAALLAQAPGLGWSSDEHPGHILFPSFAVLLAHRASRKVSDTLLADLDSTCRDPLELLSSDDTERRPKLGTPSIATLIQDVSSTITFVKEDLKSMVDSMCVAAQRRVEGILGSSRRRHYGHVAMLVASCVALAPAGGDQDLSKWMMGLRHTYSRRHAFREELRRAMESLGVSATE